MKLYLNKKVEVRLNDQQCAAFGLDRGSTIEGKIISYYYNPSIRNFVYEIQVGNSTSSVTVKVDQIVDSGDYYEI